MVMKNDKSWSRRRFLGSVSAAAGGLLVPSGQGTAIFAATSAPVRIGFLTALSGVYSKLGQSQINGLTLYLDQVQWRGGGRKIELVKEDEEASPRVGLRKMRKLIDGDRVDIVAGLISTHIAQAVRDYVHQKRMVLIISNAGANTLTRDRRSPYIFRTSFSNWQISFPLGEWVAKQVGRRVFVSAADYAAGREHAEAFKASFLRAGGQVVGEIYPPLGNADYGPFLSEIARTKPDATYNFYAGSDALKFVKQYDEYGLKREIRLTGAGFMVEEDILAAQGRSALGAVTTLHWALSLDTHANRRFVSDYRKRFHAEPDVYAVMGYDTGRVIVEALQAVGGDVSDRQRLTAALRTIQFESPRGPFRLDPETHNPIQTIYVREVQEVEGRLSNRVIDQVGLVQDPGKSS
jgi:branched-chain amino acid transport system substrate-binding protein